MKNGIILPTEIIAVNLEKNITKFLSHTFYIQIKTVTSNELPSEVLQIFKELLIESTFP